MFIDIVTFGYEFFLVKPELRKIGTGLAIPSCQQCTPAALTQAVGIIGAIIMPHNLYLHSALVKSRKIDNSKSAETKDANRYILIESAIALFVSFLINLAVTTVFAKGLSNKTNADVFNQCRSVSKNYIDMSVLTNDTEKFDADLYKAGIYLGCEFGSLPYYIWAVGIFAAGQSSTMTGTYAGQFTMEGFLNLKWPRWQRVLLTRTIAIAPTLAVTIYRDINSLTGLNDYLNALMVLQLPFAVLPTLTFSSSKIVMGKFANNPFNLIIATLLSLIVIIINIYFPVKLFLDNIDPESGWYYVEWTLASLFGIAYLLFILYLVCKNLLNLISIKKFFFSFIKQIACFLSVLKIRIPIFTEHFIESRNIEYKYIQ